MKSFAYSTLFIATTLATACATNSDEPADPTSTGGGKADGASASLTFNADFTETQSGALTAGDTVRVSYALDRLTDCRTESGGNDQYGVSGYAQFDDGAPVAFAVSRLASGKAVPVTADVEIPASASKVQFWFAINDTSGCIAYDSNENANYSFAIDRHGLGAVLSFDAAGSPSASASLHAGDKVVVHYDPARLADCEASSGGRAVYSITGYWSVDGGTQHALSVTRTSGDALEAGDPEITLPHGSELTLYFDTTSIYGCHAYDSANGANYHFQID
ncbi:MAG: DUF6209 family protein [Kofleriaceae bacterium]